MTKRSIKKSIKKVTSSLLLGSLVVGCFSEKELPDFEKESFSAINIQERFMKYEINRINKSLKNSVESAAVAINSNRSFVLSYFVDGAVTGSNVLEITSQYRNLLGLDGLILRDKNGKIISQSGVLAPLFTPLDTILVQNSSEKLFFGITKELLVSDAGLTITGVKVIDQLFLEKLSVVTAAPIFLLSGERCLLSSEDKLKQVSISFDTKKTSTKISLDGNLQEFVKTQISDSTLIISIVN